MPRKFRSGVLLLATLIFGGTSLASEKVARDPSDLDPYIRVVAAGGLWKQGELYGSCRVVVRKQGWEHSRSYVYLQWLLHDDESQALSVFKSKELTEFEADWFIVQNVTYALESGKNRFVVNLRRRLDDSQVAALLECNEPGQYELKLPEKKR